MVRTDGRWVPTRGTPTVLGVPRAPKGESRGVHPLSQAVMEDVPPYPTFLYFPLLAMPKQRRRGQLGRAAVS